jgi:cytidylate kinase
MPGVTISAGYGAGGSIVAPEVARRLGLPVLDRAISSRVAALLQVTVPEAEGGEIRRPLVDRVLGLFTPLAGGLLCAGTDAAPPEAMPPPPDDAALFRQQAEAIMNEALAAGAVILGRAGAAAFRSRPDVLRVRLFGLPEARIAQASRIENVDAPTARQLLPEVDRARAQYVRRLYGVGIDDPDLFDLQLDSTALPLGACADLIVGAYRALDRTGTLISGRNER